MRPRSPIRHGNSGRILLVAAVLLCSSACPLDARAAPVSAEPVGPGEATQQRTRCARPAPLHADPAAFPAGHRLLDVGQAWRFSRGAGVKVAVIDTGVAPHPRLPRLIAGGDYVSDGDGRSDCDLHGTLVAGLIAAAPSPNDDFAGVAPEAEIITIRQSSGAYGATASSADRPPNIGAGFGPLRTLARAIVRAVDLGARVINISETACAPTTSGLDDDTVADALETARRADVVVVVAAGNVTGTGACREQNPAVPTVLATPARWHPLVLTVGAVDAVTGAPADFSLHGPWVGVAGPGTDIVGPAGGRLVDALEGDDGARPIAGTSYATAYVSGTAALIRARYPRLSAAEVVERILRTARGGSATDPSVGFGVVDPVAALTAELPTAAQLPDPARERVLPAPPPEPGGHAAAISVAAVLAALSALLAAVFAASARRPGT